MSSEDPSPATTRRTWIVLAPLAIFAAMAGVFALALRKGDPSRLPSALIGKPAPTLTLPPLAGLSDAGQPVAGVAPGDFARGQVTVVNFWASWCGPCIEEHPFLVSLKARTGVAIVGVNYKDQLASALKFLATHGNPYTRIGADLDGRAAIEWGVYGMPETFVVDARGVIVYKIVGPLTQARLDGEIIPAIAEAERRAKG